MDAMWRIIGLSVIPGFILIIQNGISLNESVQVNINIYLKQERSGKHKYLLKTRAFK